MTWFQGTGLKKKQTQNYSTFVEWNGMICNDIKTNEDAILMLCFLQPHENITNTYFMKISKGNKNVQNVSICNFLKEVGVGQCVSICLYMHKTFLEELTRNEYHQFLQGREVND